MQGNESTRENLVLSTLSFVTDWIKMNKKLDEKDFETLKKLFPIQYEYAIKTSLEDLLNMNVKHRESKIFGKYVEILLSPAGISWLKENYEKLRKYDQSLKKKESQ